MQKAQTQAEQRKDERFEHHSELVVENAGEGAAVEGRMQNFSSGGFYFESDMFIPNGKTILIGIYDSPYSETPMSYQCQRVKIKWCKKLEDVGHRYGYGVEKLGAPEEMPAPAGGETAEVLPVTDGNKLVDRRKNERNAFLSTVYFICDRKYYAGVTKDISSGGLFIRVERPLEVGQILNLSIPNTSYEKGKMLQAKIVHLESDGIGVKITGILKQGSKSKTGLDESKKSR